MKKAKIYYIFDTLVLAAALGVIYYDFKHISDSTKQEAIFSLAGGLLIVAYLVFLYVARNKALPANETEKKRLDGKLIRISAIIYELIFWLLLILAVLVVLYLLFPRSFPESLHKILDYELWFREWKKIAIVLGTCFITQALIALYLFITLFLKGEKSS